MPTENDIKATYPEALFELRELAPPPGASEPWVRTRAVEIEAIAERHHLPRAELSAVLAAAGVAQARDRAKPLAVTALSRALSAGWKAAAAHSSAKIELKVDTLVLKKLGEMFPDAMRTISRLSASPELGSVQVPTQPVEAPTAPAPQIAAPASESDPAPAQLSPKPAKVGIAEFAARRRDTVTPPPAQLSPLDALASLGDRAHLNINPKDGADQ